MWNEYQRTRLTSARLTLAIALASVGLFGIVGMTGAAATAGAQAVGSASRAALDPPLEPLLAGTFRATGFDPAAPRALVLWRFDGATHHRLAETRSSAEGRFDFGLHPLPLVGADFGVTGAGESPDASGFRRYERAVPPPIVAAQDDDGGTLHVLTARAEGELRIADADSGQLLARIPVLSTPQRGTPIDLARVLPRDRPRAIALEHVLNDGRRSVPEIWLLESPDLQLP